MKISLLILMTILFSGCMVGPNYRPPLTYMPNNYSETPPPEEAWLVSDGAFFEWWKRFDDPLLDALLKESARCNFDLRIAQEHICQARAQFMIQTANLLPQFSFDGQAARFRSSKNILASATSFGVLFQNFFLAGFDAAWQIDLFGGLRRARKAALFTAEAVEENARFTQIAVLSEVAMQYSVIRALQQKVLNALAIVQTDQDELDYVLDRFQSGLAGELEVESVRAVLDSDLAAVQSYESLLYQAIYSLSILIGQPPESIPERFNAIGPIPEAHGLIPVGLPSQLLCRRPDIRSAERQLASATEQIGVSVANLFPSFSLTSANLFQSRLNSSNFGFASNHFRELFRHASETWSYGVSIFLPLIDFGRRLGDIKVHNSLQREALLNYEKTVIGALQEIESALTAYFKEEKREALLRDQTDVNWKALKLLEDQFQAGLANATQVAEAKRTYLISKSILTDSQQALATNLIAVYKALGGEWECFYTP